MECKHVRPSSKVERKLQSFFYQLKEDLNLPEWLKLTWLPDNSCKYRGVVSGDKKTIFIFDESLREAKETLIHEILDREITSLQNDINRDYYEILRSRLGPDKFNEIVEEFRKVNREVGKVYQRKEEVVDKLVDSIKEVYDDIPNVVEFEAEYETPDGSERTCQICGKSLDRVTRYTAILKVNGRHIPLTGNYCYRCIEHHLTDMPHEIAYEPCSVLL